MYLGFQGKCGIVGKSGFVFCISDFNDFFLLGYLITKVKSKAKIRYRYNQVPYLTRDTIKESDTHHTQEGREVSPLTVGDQKDARNSHDTILY